MKLYECWLPIAAWCGCCPSTVYIIHSRSAFPAFFLGNALYIDPRNGTSSGTSADRALLPTASRAVHLRLCGTCAESKSLTYQRSALNTCGTEFQGGRWAAPMRACLNVLPESVVIDEPGAHGENRQQAEGGRTAGSQAAGYRTRGGDHGNVEIAIQESVLCSGHGTLGICCIRMVSSFWRRFQTHLEICTCDSLRGSCLKPHK